MPSKVWLIRHMPALADRYLAEEPIPFDEYLNTVLHHCPTERRVIEFIDSGMTLQQLIDSSPVTLCSVWRGADKAFRQAIVLEAKLVLLRARAEGGQKGYAKVKEHVSAMIGMDFREHGCTMKRRARIVGSHLASTQGKFRGRFVKEAVVLKGEQILAELSGYYSAIEGTAVTPEQLRREAERF